MGETETPYPFQDRIGITVGKTRSTGRQQKNKVSVEVVVVRLNLHVVSLPNSSILNRVHSKTFWERDNLNRGRVT